jgi:hypothetical protein
MRKLAAKYGPQGRMATITTKWTGLETVMFSKPLQTALKEALPALCFQSVSKAQTLTGFDP